MAKTTKRPLSVSVARKIGNEDVHPQQDEIALEALGILNANRCSTTPDRRVPLVALQMQSGKTGVIIAYIDKCVDYCVAKGLTYQIIVLCGLSQLALIAQTRARLTIGMGDDGETPIGALLDDRVKKSGLARYPRCVEPSSDPNAYVQEGVIIRHNSSRLKKLDLRCKVDERFIIIDETHLGNNKSGCIDQFLRHHGIRISEQISSWDNDQTFNHVIGISATPFAHTLLSDAVSDLEGESLFEVIYREPPPNYLSVQVMRDQGRLHQNEEIIRKDNKPTAFFEAVLATFHKDCREQGNGHLVIRACGKAHVRLMQYINSVKKVSCKVFDSDNGNIHELSRFLGREPSAPTFVVLKGSMRAGITLPRKHHIRGWVETPSVNVDTQAQAQAGLGRACGYDREDTYPIYCNLDYADQIIRYFEGLGARRKDRTVQLSRIPSGNQNHELKGNGRRRKYPVGKEILTADEASARQKKIRAAGKGHNTAQLSCTSQNYRNNVSDMCLRGVRDNSSTIGYHFDGPPTVAEFERRLGLKQFSKKFREQFEMKAARVAWVKVLRASYDEALDLHPDWEGKVPMLDLKHPISPSRKSLQRKTSALVV